MKTSSCRFRAPRVSAAALALTVLGAVWLLAAGVATAFAAPALSSAAPLYVDPTTSLYNLPVVVQADDPVGISSASMTIDGVPRTCWIEYYAGYWDGDGCDSWWVPDTTTARIRHTIPLAAVGTHAVSVTVSNAAGATSTYAWSFVVAPSATAFSGAAPAEGSTVTERAPLVRTVADGAVTLAHEAVVTVDGVPHTVATLFGGYPYWEWDAWSYEGEVDWPDLSVGELRYAPASLADGAHTAHVDIADATGRTASASWSFTVSAPPKIERATPGDATSASTQSPRISAVVTDNGPLSATTMYVDGVQVPATLDPATGELSYVPSPPLANDATHSVRVEATDAGGLSSAMVWSFTVQIYADMPMPGTCTDCHDATQHPMDDCDACHNTVPGVGHGITPCPASWCTQCHQVYSHGPAQIIPGVTWGGGDEPQEGYTGYWGRYCDYCHQPTYPTIPQHPADNAAFHETSRDMSLCAPCHVKSLSREHYRYVDGSGAANTCDTCHSADVSTAVSTAVAAGDTDCSGCHVDVSASGHPHRASSGSPAVYAGGLACAECHSMDVPAEHAKATASSSSAGCDACHGAGGPRSSFGEWDLTCTQGACHAAGTDAAAHGAAPAGHAIGTAYARCGACHAGADASAVHGGTALSCRACHVGDVTPVTADCGICHPAQLEDHGYDPARHAAGLGGATVSGQMLDTAGVLFRFYDGTPMTYSDQECGHCHSMDLATEHGRASSSTTGGGCATCHASPRNTFGTWNKGCQQGGCHLQIHAEMASKHYHNLTGYASCGMSSYSCHNGWPRNDIAAVHNAYWYESINGYQYLNLLTQPQNGCFVCHTSPASMPSEKRCTVCHPTPPHY